MAGYATDATGREFVAIVTVEQRDGNVVGISAYDVVHAVGGRQKNGSKRVDTKSQGVYPSTDASIAISIADFLTIVNSTHQSILPQDVLNHFGEERNPGGYYTGKVKFSASLSETSSGAETDSQGRTLTEAQREFFRNSKVRDAEGRLIPMYHGTRAENGDFTVFDYGKAVKKGGLGLKAMGKGNYFTSKPLNGAERFGSRVIQAYLNLTNPFYYNGLNGDTVTLAEQVQKETGAKTQGLSHEALQEKMRELGYDGVIEYRRDGSLGVAVTFDSNQIKYTDNKAPTSDPDIRYSTSPEDGQGQSQEQRWATDFQLSAETREAYNTAAKEVARTEAEVRAMVREAQASGALAGQMNQGRRMAKQNRTLQERLDASRETIKQLKAEVRPPNRAQADPEDGNAAYGPNCSKDPSHQADPRNDQAACRRPRGQPLWHRRRPLHR